MNETDIRKIVDAAITVAKESLLQDIEDKINAAMNLGISIGAEAGAASAASAAVKAVEQEKASFKKRKHDKRLHNTKLLMVNYRALNAHYKHAVYDLNTGKAESEEFSDLIRRMNAGVYSDELYIESIKRSSLHTKVIMAHVNNMLEIYRAACEKSKKPENARHWRVLEATYILEPGKSVEEIAEAECIEKRTVYKDIDTCIKDLTTLFFGIDGLDDL